MDILVNNFFKAERDLKDKCTLIPKFGGKMTKEVLKNLIGPWVILFHAY